MKKRTLAVLMAIAMFITYTPIISYALTEETKGENDAAAEAAEVLTAPAAETEEPEEKTSDSATIDSLLLGLEPAESENETVLSESKAPVRKAFKSKAAPVGSKGTNAIKAEDIRLYGHSRFDTAKEVAEKCKSTPDSKFENLIVAYGLDYPDALSGGYLAKVKNAPILLVYASESVEDDIVDYISRNIADEGTVYILGGTGVVSSSFENKLVQKGIKKKRLGGKGRYETNLKILEEAGLNAEELLVCTGKDYADSLSASAAGKPILLVGDALTDIQMKYIEKLDPEKIFLIGGKGVVSDTIETELADYDTERLSGKDRFATSKAVAEEFFPETKTVMLVYALDFPDGLSGGPLAMLEEAPIILTDSSNIESARAYVESSGAFRSITLGGTSLISQLAVRVIMDRKPPYITPEKKYVKIQVGETAEIRIDSNYGTSYEVRNSDVSDVVSKATTYSEKGLPTEIYTVEGKQAGTAVLVLNDSYEGYETDSVTVVVIDGDASVETLYSIIDAAGYIDKDGNKAIKHKISDEIEVFFENRSGYVRLVCNVKNGDLKTFTSMYIPLDAQGNYSAVIKKEINGSEKTFRTDIDPGQYTSGTVPIIKEPTNPSVEDIDFVTSTFGESMATWNSTLEENYEMIMNDMGFTNY